MANIYEVAKRAGVSTATVSRVLSQPERRRRPTPAARSCRRSSSSATRRIPPPRTCARSRTGKLLVTVPDISNPFFSLILQGIEDAAQREGYAVLLGDTQHDEEREERYALMLKRQGGRRPDLPRPPPAEGGGGAGPRRWRRAARRSSTAASSRRGSASRACTSTTPRPRPRRWTISTASATAASAIITGPLVSPLSRDRLRGATARAEAAEAPSATSSS